MICYAISVTVDDGCQNYTEAEAAEYTFIIGTAKQTVYANSPSAAIPGRRKANRHGWAAGRPKEERRKEWARRSLRTWEEMRRKSSSLL